MALLPKPAGPLPDGAQVLSQVMGGDSLYPGPAMLLGLAGQLIQNDALGLDGALGPQVGAQGLEVIFQGIFETEARHQIW